MKKRIEFVKCITCLGKGKVKRIVRERISPEKKKSMLKLYRQGLGIRQIQRKLNIRNPYSVSYYINNCNRNQI